MDVTQMEVNIHGDREGSISGWMLHKPTRERPKRGGRHLGCWVGSG